ncbi:hypothetical protein V8C26DRAFT_400650 [Trichoderma gracile]
MNSSQSFFSLLATRPAPATWPVLGCIPYRRVCYETPAAWRGVHTKVEFPSACSCFSACPLPPPRCLHLGASELQLVALATLHCQPHALPPCLPGQTLSLLFSLALSSDPRGAAFWPPCTPDREIEREPPIWML